MFETLYFWNDMAGVFDRYIDHPESKSEGEIGLLKRRHVYVGKDSTHYIGKGPGDLAETIWGETTRTSARNTLNCPR